MHAPTTRISVRLFSRRVLSSLLAISLLTPVAGSLFAQQAVSPETAQLASDVSKKINSLTTYSVFDDIRFSFSGGKITLTGYASRPTLKDDAGRAVKSVKGITSVDNQIEVLPYSPNDDSIRARVYNAIYTEASLRKYNANQGVVRGSVATAAGGITADPPIGFHAIHIIVKNGNVTLRGSVLNKQDSDLAKIRANGVPGVFNVDDQLVVEGSAPENK